MLVGVPTSQLTPNGPPGARSTTIADTSRELREIALYRGLPQIRLILVNSKHVVHVEYSAGSGGLDEGDGFLYSHPKS